MPKYLLGYHGGGMPETQEETDRVMKAWNDWFGGLGSAVVDGGNPTMPGKMIAPNGSVGAVNGDAITGYSILEAGTLDDAVKMAKGCPILKSGGSIQVAEIMPM